MVVSDTNSIQTKNLRKISVKYRHLGDSYVRLPQQTMHTGMGLTTQQVSNS